MTTPFPMAEVAAVLIGRDGWIVLDYKPSWSAFCPPVTRLHELPARIPDEQGRRETPMEAAIRAAAEVLGRPLDPTAGRTALPIDAPIFQLSSRDGRWRRYRFHLFGMNIAFDPQPLPGHVAVWLTPAEIVTHQPLSPTARQLLDLVDPATLRRIVH